MSSMKYHQLPVASDTCQSAPREMSPIKSASVASQLNQHLFSLQQIQQQQQQQQQRAAAAGCPSMSDEEEDEEDFDELGASANFYESFQALNQQQQQQQQQRGQLNQAAAVAAAVNLQTSSDASRQQQQHGSATTANSFLMDKNKKLFPQKLWELIHNPSIQHCLRWSQDGQRVYLNRNEFEQYYLKTPNNQFHTQKAISFVRQMNMYGFRKVDDCYYENDNFRRDRKHLLKNMIRRHPNKGLFVGLDHHQLAAAAAAQQALQVNQQLQHLENQHKQRAEQALRLNNYLNQQHQQHPAFQSNFAAAAAAAAAAASMNLGQAQQQQQQPPSLASIKAHHHSSPFEQMSSQLVARAAAASHHYSQQLAQQQQKQQQFGENLTISSTLGAAEDSIAASISPTSRKSPVNKQRAIIGQQQQHQHQQQQQQKPAFVSPNHQTKKSRLLNNFYASQQQLEKQQQQANGKKLDHLNLSLSQASSHIDFQAALHQAQADIKSPHLTNGHINNNNSINGKLSRPLHGRDVKFGHLAGLGDLALDDHADSEAAAQHAALHETLVRSLLQLKQGNHHKQQDLMTALTQQHSQRTLLESLASLSSAGTGSIVDPASNSPTERTATPPSGPPSPSPYSCDNMALDLAKSTPHSQMNHQKEKPAHEDDDYAIEVDDDEDCDNARATSSVDNEMAASPLDGTKKVRRFLEDQMARSGENAEQEPEEEEEEEERAGSDGEDTKNVSIKRELADVERDDADGADQDGDMTNARKRAKVAETKQQDLNLISKLLVSEICNRRGDQLNEFALDQAAKYTQCFLDTLIDDASLIASNLTNENDNEKSEKSLVETAESFDDASDESERKQKKLETQQIDASSLSLALKLIPEKLIAAIQQKQVSKDLERPERMSVQKVGQQEQQQVAVDS